MVTRQKKLVWNSSTPLKVHLATVATCALSWMFCSPGISLIFNGCVVGVVYVSLGVMEVRRQFIWLTPLSVFFLFYSVEMGPATIYVGYGLLHDPWLPFTRWMIPAQDVATGYLVSLLGMFAMHVGIQLLRPRRQPIDSPQARALRFPFLAFASLWALGVFAVYRPLISISFGAFGIIFQYGALAALLPLAFLKPREIGISRGSHAMLLTVGTSALLAASAASQNSFKQTVVLAFLPPAALLIQQKRYRRWIPAAVGGGLLLYLGLIAPAINESRNIPTLRGMSSWDKVLQAAETHSILAATEPPEEFLVRQFGNLMGRLCEAPSSTGFLVGEVARTGLQTGNTMRDLQYAFIPRIVWPDKPIVSRGTWFTSYLGMAPRPEEATTSTGMTAYGEWYWNFGVLGVLGGMFLIGTLQGGLWRLAGDFPMYEPHKMLLYAAITINVIVLPEASTVLVALVALYLMFGCFILFGNAAGIRPIRPLEPTIRRSAYEYH